MPLCSRFITMVGLLVASTGCGSNAPVPVAEPERHVPVAQQQRPEPIVQQRPPEPEVQQQPPAQLVPERPAVQPAQVDVREISKQETRDFISDKCKKLMVDIVEGDEVVQRSESSLSFKKDGTLVVNYKYESISGMTVGDVLVVMLEVSLKDLNPKRCALHYYGGAGCNGIDLYATGDKESFKGTQQYTTRKEPDAKPSPYATNYIHFLLRESERTEKQIVRALTHLIELEGGKPDPFED